MSLQQLDKLINKLKGLEPFIKEQADKVMEKQGRFLVEENKRQLKSGLDSLSAPIEYQKIRKSPTGHYGWYSKGYEKYKEKKGGTVTYIDLYLTGDFNKSIGLLQMNPGEWRFISEDEKYTYLIANYGEQILGVSKEFLDYFSSGIMQYQIQNAVDRYLE